MFRIARYVALKDLLARNDRLEHDPEKWVPVFPRDKREAFARRSCSNKKIERDDNSSRSSAVALSRSGTVFTSISPRARASESARGSATREATLRCGEPMQLRRAGATSIVGKDFLPAIALEEPVVVQGHGRLANCAMIEQYR